MGEYDHTLSGLIRKRGEMIAELTELRERIAMISTDIEALDRVLEGSVYEGHIPLTTTQTAGCRLAAAAMAQASSLSGLAKYRSLSSANTRAKSSGSPAKRSRSFLS